MDQADSINRIPFCLVTGFLGSGKTTLLKRFLNRFADQQKIAIIQNEFAPANVDSQELRSTGKTFDILEINNGSVFCVCLLGGFVQSLADLVETCQPDLVILEATGLADPIAIGQLLGAAELRDKLYLSHTWSVIDATTFLKMESRMQRISHQVRIADTIILNKTDLVSREQLAQTEERVMQLNPWADRIPTCFCQLSDTTFERLVSTPTENHHPPAMLETFQPGGPPPITSAVLRTTELITLQRLEQFLKRYEKQAYRIKGTVNLADRSVIAVQSCFGKTQYQTIEKEPGPTELIALGPSINAREFTHQFQSLAKKPLLNNI